VSLFEKEIEKIDQVPSNTHLLKQALSMCKTTRLYCFFDHLVLRIKKITLICACIKMILLRVTVLQKLRWKIEMLRISDAA